MNAAAGAAASGAAAAAAAIAQAIKASGAIVHVEPAEFLAILEWHEDPLVVRTHRKKMLFMPEKYQYLTSYKGLAFYADSSIPLDLPAHAAVIESQKIWIPG